MLIHIRKFILLFSLILIGQWGIAQDTPNILLIIADDVGVDAIRGYHDRNLMASTPTLDSLRKVGITFENAFAAPVCSPTRAAILTGLYGINNGVQTVPAPTLDTNLSSIFDAVSEQNAEYSNAVIGKWHLASPIDPQHPIDLGVDYYMGLLGGGTQDYYNWQKTENGMTSRESEYLTSVITDKAIEWVSDQSSPWFLWWAHAAPHSPFHEPPEEMYTIINPTNNRRQFMAMIESVDYSINRLLSSMSAAEKENTLIIFIGDNGTPGQVLEDYPNGHGKGSLYQGGIRVPMIVSGAGVSRRDERESALVHVADIFATIHEVVGAELPGGIGNSLSFKHLLSNASGDTRPYNYSESNSGNKMQWTIRDAKYKLIDNEFGDQEFYDLENDSLEILNLLTTNLTPSEQELLLILEAEALQRRTAYSCNDRIQNGDENGIDCGGSYCNPCLLDATNEIEKTVEIITYPNPASDFVVVDSPDYRIMHIKAYDSFGQLLATYADVNSKAFRVPLDELRVEDGLTVVLEVSTEGGTSVKVVVVE